MARRVAEVVAVTVLATIVAATIAAPVLRAPSERLFGMELVGRHHDPFTVMEQLGRPLHLNVYSQPVTDVPGALLARIAGPVASYNWLILLSFPLSAATAYLLARYLALSPAAATLAAMAYAFSPFHLAHAAYHPHIAQTQWVPLYLLALWWCLDNASLAAVGLLAAAVLGVTLSNLYGGLIAAMITPVAVAAYWSVRCRGNPGAARRIGITVGSLVLLALSGAAYARYALSGVVADPAAFAFRRGDLFRYSAYWWSYLMPPTGHPLLGETVHAMWQAAGVHEGLLEQQVSISWGLVVLGLIAVHKWSVSTGDQTTRPSSLVPVPVLVIVGAAAFVCSLSPELTIGSVTIVTPAAVLYHVLPMFRSYARFAVVVQLMAALLAGIGVEWLRRAATTRTQVTWMALVGLAAAESIVLPSTMWRDVLPTAGHRWVMQQGGEVRALDCTAPNREAAAVPWLTNGRIGLLGERIGDCTDGNLARTLTANGYTHLIVRRDTAAGRWFAGHTVPDGLTVAARFDDGQVFAVATVRSPMHTATMTGFDSQEINSEWAWRWMGADAGWTIVNGSTHAIGATLVLELAAFHSARRLAFWLDGHPVHMVVVQPSPQIYQVGPLMVTPGYHELLFHPVDPPTVASDVSDTGDRRPLSFALGMWNWRVPGEQP